MEFNIVLQSFLFGLSGSFTHCIGMCGGIALGQNALRLMSEMGLVSPLKRFLAALSWEYYLGKALSYATLALVLLIINQNFYHSLFLLYFKKIAIFTVIIFLIYNLWLVLFSYTARKSTSFAPNFINKTSHFPLLLTGFLLGFIPCGLVYSAIIVILAASQEFYTVVLAAFTFGLGTLPGLFLLSYSGNSLFYYYKTFFKYLYILNLLWNIKNLLFFL